MKANRTLTVLLALVPLVALRGAFAADARPSEQSVRQMLEAMHTGAAVKGAFSQMNDMLAASMKNVNNGKPLNAKQEKIREEMSAKVVGLMKQQLDWSTVLEPIVVASYRDSFTPQEVNALLRFYETPIGRSVADKMPALSQHMAQLMQQRMRETMPKIQQIVRDSAVRMRAADSGEEATQPH